MLRISSVLASGKKNASMQANKERKASSSIAVDEEVLKSVLSVCLVQHELAYHCSTC